MPVTITDSDNISYIHTSERLQVNLLSSNENVEEMVLEVYFMVETKLPNGKSIGQPYWDIEPLRINCKGNADLTKAMRTIQQSISSHRHLQLTTPKPTIIPKPSNPPGT